MSKSYLILIITLVSLTFNAYAEKRTILINKTYLNFPIEVNSKKTTVYFIVDGDTVRHAKFNLSAGDTIDHWTCVDFREYQGRQLVLSSENKRGIDLIYQSDDLSSLGDSLYNEKFRPQLSYSARRSWVGDPDGLIYYKGEYHLFYQHPPFDNYNWYPAWGHAISKDLIHWKELTPALYPDKNGVIFSGSCVNDVDNTAGWGDSTLVAFYTNAWSSRTKLETPYNFDTPFNLGYNEVQCVAFSKDNGMTFTKSKENPILIGKNKWGNESRDPQVFWYASNKEWIMVLYEGNGQSIYTSKNLRNWNYESHTSGLRECPELFELAVDGDESNKKWVAMGATGAYMIGEFNGKKFTPISGEYIGTVGSRYASQIFDNVPGNRKIDLAFTLNHWYPEDLPYSMSLIFPVELSLRTTNDGIRLFREPVKEIKLLYKKSYKWQNLTGKEANEKLKRIFENDELFHVTAKVEMTKGFYFDIFCHGVNILAYDGNACCINYTDTLIYTGRMQYSCEIPGVRKFDIEMIIDRTTAEVYLDHGRMQVITGLTKAKNRNSLKFPDSESFQVHELDVHTLKSIWNKQ